MRLNQHKTPKYWVVHDKRTDDVKLETARKSLDYCIDAYVKMLMDENPEFSDYYDAEVFFYDNDNLEAILIEVRWYQ